MSYHCNHLLVARSCISCNWRVWNIHYYNYAIHAIIVIGMVQAQVYRISCTFPIGGGKVGLWASVSPDFKVLHRI